MDSESSVAVAMSYYNTICFQKGESRAGGGAVWSQRKLSLKQNK